MNIRRSETFEQQQYEEQLLSSQFSHVGSEKSEETSVPTELSSNHDALKKEQKHHKNPLKDFWDRQIAPSFPEAISDIKSVRQSMSLEHTIKKDIKNPALFPEIEHVAEVRKGPGLSSTELEFLHARKLHARENFARYLGLNVDEVHPDDVPVVCFGGSGGGYRAMLGMIAYSQSMRETGLWDLLAYVAGVSGSCWALAAYYTFGNADWKVVIEHCKDRLSPYHPLSGDAIRSVLNAPHGHYQTLGPIIQKHVSGLNTVPMDFYAVFTTGHLFMPDFENKNETDLGPQHSWPKWSDAIKHIQQGQEPLPIMTAIRHERPWKDWVDRTHPFREVIVEDKGASEDKDAWFQWFELTPLEVGCEELEAHVPTWAFGRPFSGGKSTMQLPEQSLALLLGLCISAPAGPLTSYLATVQRNLPQNFLGDAIHGLAKGITKLWGKQGTEIFRQHHPLHACNEHNFVYHLTPHEPHSPRPQGIENSPRIHLIDSGMDNNCPTFVLLHPDRECDVMINMDASSDVQKDSFQQRVDQIGSRRGLKFTKRNEVTPGPEDDPKRFKDMYAQIYDGEMIPRPETVTDSYGQQVTNPPAAVVKKECTMLYLPLLPNEEAVAGFDPSTAKFSGSYNLVWTPEQVQMLIDVGVANFKAGEQTIKTALHDAWQRKKAKRQGVDAVLQTTQTSGPDDGAPEIAVAAAGAA